MSFPNDPSIKTQVIIRAMQPQSHDACGLCLGAGQYLEALAGDPFRDLLPVQCAHCSGSGRRRAA